MERKNERSMTEKSPTKLHNNLDELKFYLVKDNTSHTMQSYETMCSDTIDRKYKSSAQSK